MNELEKILGVTFPNNTVITNATNTTKKVKKNSIFFGLQGTKVHGSKYIEEALYNKKSQDMIVTSGLFNIGNDTSTKDFNRILFHGESKYQYFVRCSESASRIFLNLTSSVSEFGSGLNFMKNFLSPKLTQGY